MQSRMCAKTNTRTSFFDCRIRIGRAITVSRKPAEIFEIEPESYPTFRMFFILIGRLDRRFHVNYANPKFFNTRTVECALFNV
jgi:hypothetical protein